MDNLSIASLVASLISRIGAGSILLFLAVIWLAPIGAMIWIFRSVIVAQKRQFEEAVDMYKSNVKLVKNYEGFSSSVLKITENLQSLVILTTTTMQTLVDHIRSNLFCPMMKPPQLTGRKENYDERS